MTDEQLQSLIEKLGTSNETWWHRVVNTTLTSLITVIVLGFFGMIWHWGLAFDEASKATKQSVAAINVRIDALQDTFKAELAAAKADRVNTVITNGTAKIGLNSSAELVDKLNQETTKTQWKIDEFIKSKRLQQQTAP